MKSESALSRWYHRHFNLSLPVFVPAAAIVFVFVLSTFVARTEIESFFTDFQVSAYKNFGWMLILTVNLAFLAALWFALGKYGRVRIGGADAVPEFKKGTWLAMLFSAGMGIGLVFFGVAEPMIHFKQPPYPLDGQPDRAALAFQVSYLHYGVYPWAVYGIVGLGMAFFTFNRGLPLSIRSIFYPILGQRIYGVIGHTIDVVAVIATLVGLATSLGFGVQQIASGLAHLTPLESSVNFQVLLIAIITLFATISVVTGLKKGVKLLSELNIWLAIGLMLLVLIVGPTVKILDVFVQSTGNYLQNIISLGTWTEAFRRDGEWQHDWTVFYWAWWIAWSPFVGIFIARISKGRTVREFLLNVLIVPVLFTFFWFSVFGTSALELELAGISAVGEAIEADLSTALFVMLEQYPLAIFTSVVGILLVTSFFVTSSDSGSLVVDMLTSGGALDAPVGQRIFWAITEGAVAAALLMGGGLKAMQSMSIAAGIPYAFLVLVMIFSIRKGLHAEWLALPETKKPMGPKLEKVKRHKRKKGRAQ